MQIARGAAKFAATSDAWQASQADREQALKQLVSRKTHKHCSQCSLLLPVEAFEWKSSGVDGLAAGCKPCKSQRMSTQEYVRILLHANVKNRLQRLGQGQQTSVTSMRIQQLLGYSLDDLVQHLQDKLQRDPLLKSDRTPMTMQDWR